MTYIPVSQPPTTLSTIDSSSYALQSTATPPIANYNSLPDSAYVGFESRNYTLNSPALNQVPSGLTDWDFIIEVGTGVNLLVLNFGTLRSHPIVFDLYEAQNNGLGLKAYFQRHSYSVVGTKYKTQFALADIPNSNGGLI